MLYHFWRELFAWKALIEQKSSEFSLNLCHFSNMVLSRSRPLFEPQFPHLQNRNGNTCLAYLIESLKPVYPSSSSSPGQPHFILQNASKTSRPWKRQTPQISWAPAKVSHDLSHLPFHTTPGTVCLILNSLQDGMVPKRKKYIHPVSVFTTAFLSAPYPASDK